MPVICHSTSVLEPDAETYRQLRGAETRINANDNYLPLKSNTIFLECKLHTYFGSNALSTLERKHAFYLQQNITGAPAQNNGLLCSNNAVLEKVRVAGFPRFFSS